MSTTASQLVDNIMSVPVAKRRTKVSEGRKAEADKLQEEAEELDIWCLACLRSPSLPTPNASLHLCKVSDELENGRRCVYCFRVGIACLKVLSVEIPCTLWKLTTREQVPPALHDLARDMQRRVHSLIKLTNQQDSVGKREYQTAMDNVSRAQSNFNRRYKTWYKSEPGIRTSTGDHQRSPQQDSEEAAHISRVSSPESPLAKRRREDSATTSGVGTSSAPSSTGSNSMTQVIEAINRLSSNQDRVFQEYRALGVRVRRLEDALAAVDGLASRVDELFTRLDAISPSQSSNNESPDALGLRMPTIYSSDAFAEEGKEE